MKRCFVLVLLSHGCAALRQGRASGRSRGIEYVARLNESEESASDFNRTDEADQSGRGPSIEVNIAITVDTPCAGKSSGPCEEGRSQPQESVLSSQEDFSRTPRRESQKPASEESGTSNKETQSAAPGSKETPLASPKTEMPKTIPVKVKASDPSSVDSATTEVHEIRGFVAIDAGSSGCKLASIKGDSIPKSPQITTQCTVDPKEQPLTGVACLSYEPDKCRAKVTIKKEGCGEPTLADLKTQAAVENYAALLLDQLKVVHEGDCARDEVTADNAPDNALVPCGPRPTNADAVPILATAGMRLLSKKSNEDIWNKICGKSGKSAKPYTFATRASKLCGCIPGTKEAHYEWVASLVDREQSDHLQIVGKKTREGSRLTGTFSIGGASAQIAIPLATVQALEDWQTAMRTVKEFMEPRCENIKLENGDSIPIFGNEEKCWEDFISFEKPEDVLARLPKALKKKSGFANPETGEIVVKGIGYVSFLGLGLNDGISGGTGFAGGTNAVEKWAKNNGCGKAEKNFAYERCKGLMEQKLEEDKLFKAVKEFFKKGHVGVYDFEFITPASIPHFQVDQTDKSKLRTKLESEELAASDCEGGRCFAGIQLLNAELAKAFEEYCTQPGNKGFGHMHSNTCMKAAWMYHFMTDFFPPGESQAPQGTQQHFYFDPIEWSLGFVSEVNPQPNDTAH